jgi:hypothetical protein
MARPKSTTRNSAGRFTPIGIRSHLTLTGDPIVSVIAREDLVVHDDNLGIDRKLFAGQEVPPDLVDAYAKATGANVDPSDEVVEADRLGAAHGTGTSTGVVPEDTAASKSSRRTSKS